MSILTALAFVPLPRKTIADPVTQRRATFIKQLEQQLKVSKAEVSAQQAQLRNNKAQQRLSKARNKT